MRSTTNIEEFLREDDDEEENKKNEENENKKEETKDENELENKNEIEESTKTKTNNNINENESEDKKNNITVEKIIENKENEEIEENEENEKKSKKKNKNKENKQKEEDDYNQILEYMKNLQPDASKKKKKKTYELIKDFVSNCKLSQESLDLIIIGDKNKKILGLCELTSKKTKFGNFKGSTLEFLKIIYSWFYESKNSEILSEEFSINDEYLKKMNLGEHYSRLKESNKKTEKALALKIIKIIIKIRKKRSLDLIQFIKSGFISLIENDLKDLEDEEEDENVQKQKKKIEEMNLKTEKDIIEEEMEKNYNKEPKTWEEAEKKNKKLLTVEFLSFGGGNFVDDEKENEIEFIDNFIDPITNEKLNIKNFNEDEINKIHIQQETFDPMFFLEKLYKKMSVEEFKESIINIENNLKGINAKDEKLIDKNIYKYLDCKKLLDSILQKFKEETNKFITEFNTNASTLEFNINDKLENVKESFDLIIQSKQCKEILNKLSKYFIMKDRIENFLKFNNIDDLADYLKKINYEIKNISQNRLLYGEFYNYFYKKVEDFKNVLIDIIKNSPVNEASLKYFKYLLEFDVECEIIDKLINLQKEKMCDKIKNYLESKDNIEIKILKNFFCDEFKIENYSDEIYEEIIQNVEKKMNNNIEILNKNDENKEKINVENIISSLLNEINDFLFTMKVLDESLDLKSSYKQRDTKFSTISTEIYFILFDKLKNYLFDDNFNMQTIIKNNYFDIYKFPQNEYINDLYIFFNENQEIKNAIFNEKFNKNALQNLSNLIIEMFEKFEFHLNSEIIESLSENKTIIISKIFHSFLNEKIKSTLNFFINENTINFTETEISIFNFSYFDFTKNFFKLITQNYINIIQFYMNIVTKIKNCKLDYKIIYLTFFFILKCFVLRFLIFYNTEKKYNNKNTDINLNCLIVETIRNLNYIEFILKYILKNLFRNKENDYNELLLDFYEYLKNMKKIFLDEYIFNASTNLLNVYLNIQNNKENIRFNFYEKYNELLISNSNNFECFNDSRSVLIDLIVNIENCVKDFDIIFTENFEEKAKTKYNSISLIQEIIELFYDNFLNYCREKIDILMCKNDENKNGFKYVSQLLLELQIFSRILNDYTNIDKIKNKEKLVEEILLEILMSLKGKNLNDKKISENKIFNENEILKKEKLIEIYLNNYSSLFKFFIKKK